MFREKRILLIGSGLMAETLVDTLLKRTEVRFKHI